MSNPQRMAGALLLLLGVGCQPEVTCPKGGLPCGGDPSGAWSVVAACRDPAFARPLQGTYFQQPVQVARQPTPTIASSDWCSSLVLANVMGATGVSRFSFPHDTLSVTNGGQITYMSDDSQHQQGIYEAVIKTAGSGGIDVSQACMTRTGMALSCDMLAAALTQFAATKPSDPGIPCNDGLNQPATCQFYFSYQDIACAPIASGGCHCTYGVSFAGTQHGRWLRSGAVLTHSDASRMLPTQADYCVGGSDGSMTLWGHDQTSILDQTGIRTLDFQRVP